MCKQTCESSEMAGDLQVSLKCTKMSRNRGHFLDLDVQLPEQVSATTPPPPSERGPLSEITENVCYSPPPTESGRLLETGDHAQNLPGGIGRMPPPPKQKSWLRRWRRLREYLLARFVDMRQRTRHRIQ